MAGSWRTGLSPRGGLRLDPQIYHLLPKKEIEFPNCWAAQQLHRLPLKLLSLSENVVTDRYVWMHVQSSVCRLPLWRTHLLPSSCNVRGKKELSIQPVWDFSNLPNFVWSLLPSELMVKVPLISWGDLRAEFSIWFSLIIKITLVLCGDSVQLCKWAGERWRGALPGSSASLV